MKRNIDRVSKIAEAGVETGKFIQSCFDWESKARSITAFIVSLSVYTIFCLPNSIRKIVLQISAENQGLRMYCLYRPERNGACTYSLFQKKRTFNSEFFGGPPGEGGPKIHMVDYVNWSSIHAQFFSWENLQPFWRCFKMRRGMAQNKNCSFHKSP